jgi:carboxyl-terminal processing protease
MFWDKVFYQTSSAIDELKKHDKIKKIIIDLRNNPGWYLDQAVNILSLFIPKSNPVAVVKYKNWDLVYDSYWYDKIDLWKYEVYILANSWTASASEILIWSLKDYFPNIKIIWENTYWKWSVQTIKYYNDGSSLKYTVAKWYTWKTNTWIDWVWISPDIKVDLDIEKFKSWIDTQLNYILNWLR